MQVWLTDRAVWSKMYIRPIKIPDCKGNCNVYTKFWISKSLIFLISQRNSLGKNDLEGSCAHHDTTNAAEKWFSKLDFLLWNYVYQEKCGKLFKQLTNSHFFQYVSEYVWKLFRPFMLNCVFSSEVGLYPRFSLMSHNFL